MDIFSFLGKYFSLINEKDVERKRLIKSIESLVNKFPIIQNKFKTELNTPPRIALIGPTGVGKSSTINKLFGTQLPVKHYVATTKIAYEIELSGEFIKGEKGSLIVYDMPGVGEDIEIDLEHIETYRQVLTRCDVAVWIISASDRRIAYDQYLIGEIIAKSFVNLSERIIVGVNKADQMYPFDWDNKMNLPSPEQEENLILRKEDVFKKLSKVCPTLNRDRIVFYSAEKHYRLERLFAAMLSACPRTRRWVLSSRENREDFWELVDADLREKVFARIR